MQLTLPADPPLNAKPGVKYVGSEACVECHQDQHKTFLETAHSKSMERVDPDKEIGTAKFRHPLSMNDYEVETRDGRLFHREIQRGAGGEELSTTEREIVFTIGSGTHGKSYVYREGNFFGQSPLSWYEESNQWAMSPGYDLAYHPGFGRRLSSECFFCHVGNIDSKAGNPNDFSILEETIGCERCHGPGELHVAKYKKTKEPDSFDNTIVNPAKLKREVSEAICQQCHLQAAGKAMMAGKDEWDFRPGLPLTDFRIDYQYRLGDDSMKVVGHVEQLHQSKCYQQTKDLTCITCHNPHETPTAEESVAYYRSICLDCHQNDSCGEPLQKRHEVAMNDCSQCHMPAKDTEVPHTALHHHRIGIHRKGEGGDDVVVGLTAVLDTSELTPMQRARGEAMAKFQVAQEQADNENFRDYGIEAAKALIAVKNAGQSDADSDTVLALLAQSQQQSQIAENIAEEVVQSEVKPTRPRIESLRLLAQLAYRSKDFAQAVKYYRELTQYQHQPYDFFHLGICEQNTGQSDNAIQALEKAIDLAPNYTEAHRVLAAILGSKGKTAEAQRHAELAQKHQARLQQLMQNSQGR